jgi:hypothetical protein
MGTKFRVVLSAEHGIDGDGEYLGDNDSQLDCINAFCFYGRARRRTRASILRSIVTIYWRPACIFFEIGAQLPFPWA